MDDWTKQPFKSEPYGLEKYHKTRCLTTKRTLEFIAKFPEGATRKDFEKANVPISGIERLMKLKLIKATQIKEPERGTRAYRWLWKINNNTISYCRP